MQMLTRKLLQGSARIVLAQAAVLSYIDLYWLLAVATAAMFVLSLEKNKWRAGCDRGKRNNHQRQQLDFDFGHDREFTDGRSGKWPRRGRCGGRAPQRLHHHGPNNR